MADVISIEGKLQLTRDKQAELVRKRKIAAVRKVFQCTHCSFKCEKCGTQMAAKREKRDTHARIPYRFCESCTEEYLEYIERLQGGGDPDRYWHNDAWLAVWQAWIDYQSSLDTYLKSKEFLMLLQEMKQGTPDQ